MAMKSLYNSCTVLERMLTEEHTFISEMDVDLAYVNIKHVA